VVYTEGGGYGFDCKHRCAGKRWKDFRAELERRFPDRKFSFVDAEEMPRVFSGDATASSTPDAPEIPTQLADWRTLFHTREAMLNAPPITYSVNGKQYVAVLIGGSTIAQGVLSKAPETKDIQNTSMLYVFSL